MSTRQSGSRIVPRRFLCSDAGDARGVEAVYDRAALISWMPALRAPYVGQWRSLLARVLACCSSRLEYPQSQMAGPPFSVSARRDQRLYSPKFSIEEIARQDILASEARLRSARGHGILRSVLSARAALNSSTTTRRNMAESRTSGRYLAPALVACAAAASCAMPAELTIDRLFDAPALAGTCHHGTQDLARCLAGDLSSRQARRQGPARPLGVRPRRTGKRASWWIRELLAPADASSPRRRSAAASASARRRSPGSWSIRSRRRAGRCCSHSMAGSTTTTSKARAKPWSGSRRAMPLPPMPTISPRGGYVAYIRDQNLHVYRSRPKSDRALTEDGGGAIKNGIAEFIAQEEMGRSTAATGGRPTTNTSPSCASMRVP